MSGGAPQPPELQPVSTNFMPEARQQYQEGPSGFQEVLGEVGDAISVGAGGQPHFQQGEQQRRFENALATYQHDPERGIQEVMAVAPDVGMQLQQQQAGQQQARREQMMQTAPQMRRDLERAIQQGQDPSEVIDQYARNPQVGPVLFDDQEEVEQMKAMAAQDPQSVVQSLPQGAHLLSDEELEAQGWKTDSNVQFVPGEGYEVVQEPERPEPERANIVPQGQDQPVSAMISPHTGVATWFEEGRRRFARPGEYSTVGQNVQGTREDVIGAEARNLRDLEVNTKNFVGTVGETLDFLNENPDANTWTGQAAAFVNDLQQEAIGLARNTGFYEEDIQDSNLLDPEKYGNKFDELGIANRELRSMLTSLAYQDARRFENGRLSTDDIRLAFDRIGAQSSDPRAIANVLRNSAERAKRHFENSWTTRKEREDAPPPPSVGLENLPSGPGGNSAGPEVGTIDTADDGTQYRFTGGNPNDPNNWEAVQ